MLGRSGCAWKCSTNDWNRPASKRPAVEAAAGVSAAIAPAAMPKVNKAEAIKVPDLFMGSPAMVLIIPRRIRRISGIHPR